MHRISIFMASSVRVFCNRGKTSEKGVPAGTPYKLSVLRIPPDIWLPTGPIAKDRHGVWIVQVLVMGDAADVPLIDRDHVAP